jgi:LPS sulfotransferase NodH
MSAIERAHLVCATPRSGSTLLCELLKEAGVAGRPEEYFETLRSTSCPRQPRQYFEGAPEVQALLPEVDPGTPERAFDWDVRHVRVSRADRIAGQVPDVSRMRRQSGERSREWIERYGQEAA